MLEEIFDSSETDENQEYPIATDTEFTIDEISAIKEFKKTQLERIAKKRNTLEIIERIAWSVSSYSLARWLVLTSGSMGLNLAIISIITMNNIANRRLFDDVNIDYEDGGLKMRGMGKLVRIGGGLITSLIIGWSALGDFYDFKRNSEITYDNLTKMVEDFNNLPSDEDRWKVIAVGGGIAFGIYGAAWLINKK
ncbi:MAG: hypothetical protein AAF915_23565 [Cyanobacteria bacterium P01_D01_bin.50]